MFVSIAFHAQIIPMGVGNFIWTFIIGYFLFKYAIEVILEPITHKTANYFKKVEGADVFESAEKFTLFGGSKI